MSAKYKFFNHKTCEYFPCHKTENKDDFNCMFCFCPLYALGPSCGGNFKYLENGTKDCSECLIPHRKNGYEYIMSKFDEIKEKAEKI